MKRQMNWPLNYQIAPITGREARAWVSDVHRHLPRVHGALFAVSVELDGVRVGAALAGNPARVWLGTRRFVITRCAVLPDLPEVRTRMPGTGRPDAHAAPVCSMLYGALCRAGKALGYVEAWTYTLPGENGRSIRAAGFEYQGETSAEEWDRPGRARPAAVDPRAKGRWMRRL